MFQGVGVVVVPRGGDVSKAQIEIWRCRMEALGGHLWQSCPPPGVSWQAHADDGGGKASGKRKHAECVRSSSTGSTLPRPSPSASATVVPTHIIIGTSIDSAAVDAWWTNAAGVSWRALEAHTPTWMTECLRQHAVLPRTDFVWTPWVAPVLPAPPPPPLSSSPSHGPVPPAPPGLLRANRLWGLEKQRTVPYGPYIPHVSRTVLDLDSEDEDGAEGAADTALMPSPVVVTPRFVLPRSGSSVPSFVGSAQQSEQQHQQQQQQQQPWQSASPLSMSRADSVHLSRSQSILSRQWFTNAGSTGASGVPGSEGGVFFSVR